MARSKSNPQIALKPQDLVVLLALFDAIRGGSAREMIEARLPDLERRLRALADLP